MSILHPNAAATARAYIGTDAILTPLGWGIEGVVFPSPGAMTAVKVHSHEESFAKELAAYKRLTERRVTEIQGFSIPQFVRFDAALRVIEMSIVRPPYLLDFAQTDLDKEPDFPEGIDEWWDRVRDRFGDQFPVVQSVFYELVREHGIYYWDLKPGNIEFSR